VIYASSEGGAESPFGIDPVLTGTGSMPNGDSAPPSDDA